MNKIQKTAKSLDRLFSFFQKLTVVAIVIGAIGLFLAWYMWLGDKSVWQLFYTTLKFGGIEFQLDRSVVPAENALFLYLLFGTLLGALQLPVLYMTFGSIRGILELMIEGTPFHEHIVYYIKRLGWLTIAGGIINIFAGFVVQGNFLPKYDLASLFLSEQITKVTTTYSADVSFIVYAIVLFLLAEVFRYGMQLQQLSDETL